MKSGGAIFHNLPRSFVLLFWTYEVASAGSALAATGTRSQLGCLGVAWFIMFVDCRFLTTCSQLLRQTRGQRLVDLLLVLIKLLSVQLLIQHRWNSVAAGTPLQIWTDGIDADVFAARMW